MEEKHTKGNTDVTVFENIKKAFVRNRVRGGGFGCDLKWSPDRAFLWTSPVFDVTSPQGLNTYGTIHTKHTISKGSNQHTYPVTCLLYTSPSPRDQRGYRMPSSA